MRFGPNGIQLNLLKNRPSKNLYIWFSFDFDYFGYNHHNHHQLNYQIGLHLHTQNKFAKKPTKLCIYFLGGFEAFLF
jgi:hypothetical protein